MGWNNYYLIVIYSLISNDFQISWYDERNMIITEGVRTIHELMDDGKRFVSLSILRFKAGMNHNGKNITCHAQNSATPQPQSVSTRLDPHLLSRIFFVQNKFGKGWFSFGSYLSPQPDFWGLPPFNNGLFLAPNQAL